MTQGQLILIGGGGHAKVVVDCARSSGFEIAGFLDDGATPALAAAGYNRLGATTDWYPVLSQLSAASQDQMYRLFNAIGDNERRRHVTERLLVQMEQSNADDRSSSWSFATIEHERAIVSRSAQVEHGVLIGPGSIVNAFSTIREGVIVNSGAIVEHDCEIDRFAHVGPGVVLGGEVRVGSGALVGLGARVKPGVSIGANAVVGSGAVVCDDVPVGATVKGVPARSS